MFKFKNISSKDMKVVCEEETNFLKKASLIVETPIQGENLDLDYNVYGYNNVDGSINIFITDKTKLDEIMAWLNGKGILEYNDRITKVAFFDLLEPIRSATIYISSVNFIRSAFWYKKNDEFETITDNILNEGNIYSYPIIRLEKNLEDTVDLTINGIRFVYNFPENESYVEIDCDKAEALYNDLNRNLNLNISFEFPKINPGNNPVTLNIGDATIKVKRKDCWL